MRSRSNTLRPAWTAWAALLMMLAAPALERPMPVGEPIGRVPLGERRRCFSCRQLSLNGGASMIKRGGEAFDEVEDHTDVGGVIGATVGFRLDSMHSFYVAAEDYI